MTGRPIDLTFVSRNPGKVAEARELLTPYDVRVRWVRRQLREPQADSLEEVVRSKLNVVHDLAGWVLVEDSGLFIPSLKGFPGVYSAHFLDIWGFDPIFQLLRNRARTAYYRSVAGLTDGRRSRLFTGEVHGTIARRAVGANGFGYDPIFIPRGSKRTFAQATSAQKGAVSHRGVALRKAGRFLASL